jgi:hypothetical protein
MANKPQSSKMAAIIQGWFNATGAKTKKIQMIGTVFVVRFKMVPFLPDFRLRMHRS